MTDATLTEAAPKVAAAPPTTASPATASAGALLLLMALTALGQMATNLVVPSLGTIVAELELELGASGLILSAVLLGIGAGQLVVGPLSDRFGRRPLLLAGLVLYVVASLGATFAGSGPTLLLARLAQGLGASAGLALPRAIARDRYVGPAFLRVMSLLTLAMAIMPGLAPVLGGLVSQQFGWRASLAVSAVSGLGVFVAVVMALPESHHNRSRTGGIAATLGGYRQVVRARVFLGYALASGSVIGGSYAAVAGVQGLYGGSFGWTPGVVSCIASTYAAGFLLGGVLAPRLPIGHRGHIWLGLALMLLGAGGFLLLAATGAVTAILALGAVVLFQVGVGCMMPPSIGLALMAVDGNAGTASAVMGAIHMGSGAAGAALVGAIAAPVTVSMPAIMLGFALFATACTLLARQPRG